VRRGSILWGELTSNDVRELDASQTVTVQPVGAIEQHGPHLPLMTDTAIADGMTNLLRARLPDDLSVVILPTLTISKSNEHILSPGTLSFCAATLQQILFDIAQGVHHAGLRKIVFANAHGGNDNLLAVAIREMRVNLGMLAVATHWQRFGLPAGMFDPLEEQYGIHGGDIETSLMLHFRPDLVRMDRAQNFVSRAISLEQESKFLRAEGQHTFGWIAQDLHADGVVGNAANATAEKGRITAEHQTQGFIGLIRDVAKFSLSWLHAVGAADGE